MQREAGVPVNFVFDVRFVAPIGGFAGVPGEVVWETTLIIRLVFKERHRIEEIVPKVNITDQYHRTCHLKQPTTAPPPSAQSLKQLVIHLIA